MSNGLTKIAEAAFGTSALTAGLECLRIAAGIELETSFDAGSKWCVGDEELAALVALAKAEEREACAKVCEDIKYKHEYVRACVEAIRKRSNVEFSGLARAVCARSAGTPGSTP